MWRGTRQGGPGAPPAASQPEGSDIDYFPVFLDLRGRLALVLGDGEAAARKCEALERAGAVVRRAERFSPTLLEGLSVAVGADAAEAELVALSRAARAAGIPVNIVDRPELCSFITPATIERGRLTIAISSGGSAPMLARAVRARIEALLPPDLGRVAAWLDGLKAPLRRRFPDMRARRRAIEVLLSGPAAAFAAAGDATAAAHAAEAVMAEQPTRPAGIVYLVGQGPGPADLLTLRAHRLLGEADVIVHDRPAADGVLDLARRDARKIFVGERGADPGMARPDIIALLVRLAREGDKVVRLTGGDAPVGRGGEEAEACAAAGVACEVVPGVSASWPAIAGGRALSAATGGADGAGDDDAGQAGEQDQRSRADR